MSILSGGLASCRDFWVPQSPAQAGFESRFVQSLWATGWSFARSLSVPQSLLGEQARTCPRLGQARCRVAIVLSCPTACRRSWLLACPILRARCWCGMPCPGGHCLAPRALLRAACFLPSLAHERFAPHLTLMSQFEFVIRDYVSEPCRDFSRICSFLTFMTWVSCSAYMTHSL